MNDQETVALIAGGHTFGKTHGAGTGGQSCRARAGRRAVGVAGTRLAEHVWFSGKGADTITSGLEVTWTDKPTQWSNRFFEILFGHEWEQDDEPWWGEAVGRQGFRGRSFRTRMTRPRSTGRPC